MNPQTCYFCPLVSISFTDIQLSSKMELKIVLAADGFGTSLKDAVIEHLRSAIVEGKKYTIEDLGTADYFEVAKKVARAVQASGRSAGELDKAETTRGILFCGSGMGVAIIANKFQGIAAAVVENEHAARCSRAINDSNVLCLGGTITPEPVALQIVDAWLEQGFGHPPCHTDGKPPEWWSCNQDSIGEFLKDKWPKVHEVERDSRSSASE